MESRQARAPRRAAVMSKSRVAACGPGNTWGISLVEARANDTTINIWALSLLPRILDQRVFPLLGYRTPQVKLSQNNQHPDVRLGFFYLNDAAPAGRSLHRLQQDGVRVLAATGQDDAAAPAAGRSGRNAVRSSVAAQRVSISITVRHVDEEEEKSGSMWRRGEINQVVRPEPNKV